MPSSAHHIFISHSHLDNAFASQLAQDLRRTLNDEQAVWYDVLGLHGGQNWWEKIIEELTARDIFLLVLSPDALNSPWVRREINMALIENKYILPILYRDCTIRPDLKALQIISFLAPKTYEEAFQEVLVALGLPAKHAAVETRDNIEPSNDLSSLLLRQLEKAFSDQDWPDVIRKANYLINHMPAQASSTVYRMQGLAYSEEGEMQHAQEALETALALVNDKQQRLTLLSDYTALLALQKQWDKVLKRAREALRLLPNDPAWLATQKQAQEQLSASNATSSSVGSQAQTKEEKTSSLPQKTSEQWRKEGWTLFNDKRYNEALEAFEQAIRLNPNDTEAYYGKGVSLNWLNRFEESIAACEQAIRLNPNYAPAYYGKGGSLSMLKRYEEALAAFEQAIRLNPNDAKAYYGKGASLSMLNRFEEAVAAHEQAIRLKPNYAEAYYGKGVSLESLKRYEEVIAAYEQAIHFNPTYATAYYRKGVALEKLGKRKEAQEAYAKAREFGYSG